jgi:hemerythrin superfamily protein
MAVDPFTMLELDHRHVEALLDRLAESDERSEREEALRDLEASLTAHMQFEEQQVYPLVAQVMDQETEDEAEVEHGLARDGLAKLGELVAAPGFGAAVEMVKGAIAHHVAEEENEIFPELRGNVSDEQQRGLADELVLEKKAAGLPVVPPEATKAQVDALARALEIEGRSGLSRDELVQAITAGV